MTKKLMLGAALSALMVSGALAQAPPAPTSPPATPPASVPNVRAMIAGLLIRDISSWT